MEITNISPRKYARLGGIFYLINIVLGIFSIAYVESIIVVDGNPAATVYNIIAHEFLFRLGIVAHIIILLTNFPLALIFYRLFRIVNKDASLLIVFFTLVGTAIEAANLLNQFAPLLLLKSGTQAVGSLNQEQTNEQVITLLRLKTVGFNLALIFYAFYDLSAGYLIFKSAFLPKSVGIFLATGGLCYLTYSFAAFLAPKFADSLVPYIQIPSGLAELTFCLWLLIAGVNLNKWKEQEQIALS
jgi:hypothetical protein